MLATLISGDRSLPGDQLERRVLQAAGALEALGLQPGDVVALLMRNDFPFIEATFAADRMGLVAVPLNWHGTADEAAHILQDSQARVLIAHSDLLQTVRAQVPAGCTIVEVKPPPEIVQAYRLTPVQCAMAGALALDYEAWLSSAPAPSRTPAPPPYRLLYTSGTTGLPKGVRRDTTNKELMGVMGLRTRVAHGLEIRPIRAVMTGPLYHSAPNIYAQNCVRFGEVLVLMPRFDARQLLALITQHRISHMHAVPTMFSRLLDLPQPERAAFDHSVIKAVVHGAAMCPPEIKRDMIAWWGPVILEYYAATEIGIITASTSQQWLDHPGSVGCTPEGVRVRVVSDQGDEVPTGEQGEIMIETDVASLVTYQNRPEAVEELRRGNWVTLGDIGYVDAENFLWICDRKKDLVISGGVNIFPAELERAAAQLEAVRDCVAFGIPDRDLGEALALYIEPHPGHENTDLDAIRDALAKSLGRMRAPKVVRSLPVLPREDSGKIARRKLRQVYLDSLAAKA